MNALPAARKVDDPAHPLAQDDAAAAPNGGTTSALRPSAYMVDLAARHRTKLERAGSLHWIHWCIVSLSLLLTLGAWYASKSQLEEKVAARFEREAAQVANLIVERMQKYEDALWAGVALIRTLGADVSNAQWREYAKSIRIGQKYPGINGIGVIHSVSAQALPDYLDRQRRERPDFAIHPPHPGDEHLPITYIEPVRGNEQAVGLDMAHESNRFTAALRARDTGEAQITGPIVLVQDAQRTPGFLFYAPFYESGGDALVSQRHERFLGMVYAPFVVTKLMQGALAKSQRHVSVRLSDAGNMLYDEHDPQEAEFDPQPLFKITRDVPLYGRTWQIDIRANKTFREAAASAQPLTILAGGVLIDGLLLTLFIMLSRANRGALTYADEVTNDLRASTRQLQRSNEELQKFAYVASHDLKAPLRAIAQLAHWISKDAGELLPQRSRRHLDLLNGRTRRMDALLDSLLRYARVGYASNECGSIDLNRLLKDVVALLEPPAGFDIVVQPGLPIIRGHRLPLAQVLQNLIANALLHHDRAHGHILVECEQCDDQLVFRISDDGPGIAVEYHARVFEIFQTLKRRDEAEFSGMGLAIVKKVLETHGGSVCIEPRVGRGTTVCFTWPIRAVEAIATHTTTRGNAA